MTRERLHRKMGRFLGAIAKFTQIAISLALLAILVADFLGWMQLPRECFDESFGRTTDCSHQKGSIYADSGFHLYLIFLLLAVGCILTSTLSDQRRLYFAACVAMTGAGSVILLLMIERGQAIEGMMIGEAVVVYGSLLILFGAASEYRLRNKMTAASKPVSVLLGKVLILLCGGAATLTYIMLPPFYPKECVRVFDRATLEQLTKTITLVRGLAAKDPAYQVTIAEQSINLDCKEERLLTISHPGVAELCVYGNVADRMGADVATISRIEEIFALSRGSLSSAEDDTWLSERITNAVKHDINPSVSCQRQ